jgi:crotonobetainyl-CoA:carnitine CoA-transferase CaiB-like acyl-CoA transferase
MGMFRDPRFKDLPTAFVNREAFHDYAAAWTKERTIEEVEEAFFAFEGASAPCNNAEDLINDPHELAREHIVTVDDPDLGPVRMQGLVPKFSRAPGKVRWAGEQPGTRNAEVYGELLGLTAKELDGLRAADVI